MNAPLKFTTTSCVSPVQMNTGVFLCGVFEDAQQPVSALAVVRKFDAKVGQTLSQNPGESDPTPMPQTVFFGLGKKDKFNISVLREALTAAFKSAKELKVADVTMAALPEGSGIDAELFGQTVAEYAGMVNYRINHFKTTQGGHKPEAQFAQVSVNLGKKSLTRSTQKGLQVGHLIASAVNNTRNLVNLPAGICTPMHLASEAQKLSVATKGAIKVRLVKRGELKRLGANAFLAVSQGSVQEPVLIELTYQPSDAVPNVVLGLVGKSVTFDSGGLDIKSADGMLTMKCDMAGGATVLSAIGAIATLKLPLTVKAYMAATENMTGGAAYKPGDVLTTMAGLTVEVGNTDAEGRLTLADAITFAKKFGGVTHLVDLATLTGAMLQTTADVGAGIFTNNADWQAQVMSAAESVDELVWPMPMWPALKKGIESKIADLKNTGGTFGAGSSTAALFLQAFAGDTPWVHIDIAGTAFRRRSLGADPDDATGWGTRTLIALARQLSQSK